MIFKKRLIFLTNDTTEKKLCDILINFSEKYIKKNLGLRCTTISKINILKNKVFDNIDSEEDFDFEKYENDLRLEDPDFMIKSYNFIEKEIDNFDRVFIYSGNFKNNELLFFEIGRGSVVIDLRNHNYQNDLFYVENVGNLGASILRLKTEQAKILELSNIIDEQI